MGEFCRKFVTKTYRDIRATNIVHYNEIKTLRRHYGFSESMNTVIKIRGSTER